MMNVIAGIFLDTAVNKARDEKESWLAQNARRVFTAADQDRSGMISWEDFENALHHGDMHTFFKAIDIDISEAKSLFDLLDLSGDGNISADEFLNGCLHVRGPAKSLDLFVL